MVKKKRSPSRSIMDELEPGFSEKSTRGKTNQAKSKAFERKIAIAFRVVCPKAKRSFGQAREGNEIPDIVGTPFWLECGTGSTISIQGKLKQALSDAATTPNSDYRDRPPVVVVHNPRTHVVSVTMTIDDFLALVGTIHGG